MRRENENMSKYNAHAASKNLNTTLNKPSRTGRVADTITGSQPHLQTIMKKNFANLNTHKITFTVINIINITDGM